MAEQQNQNQKAAGKEPDLHQLLKVRREKLAELQAEVSAMYRGTIWAKMHTKILRSWISAI